MVVCRLMVFDHASQYALEFRDAAGQVVNGLPFGVGEPAVFQNAALGTDANHTSGNTDDGGMIRDRVDYHAARADLDVVPDHDIAEDLGASTDDDAVADGGMALTALCTSSAQCHALVDQHVVANLSGFADDYAGAMVDEKAVADSGAGVDLDLSKEPADLRKEAW